MAYNLQPLITILEQILNPQQTLWIVDHNKPQLESLLQKATSLQQILDKSLLTKIESLESQIRDAAHEAEDIIESHMVDQMLPTKPGIGKTTLARKLYKDPSIVSHFKSAHAWTTVSQGYEMKAVILSLLHCICGKESDHHAGKESHDAEDTVESHMVDQMLPNPEAVGLTFSTPDLQLVMQQLDSVMEQVAKLVEVKTDSSSGASFSRHMDSLMSKALVGVDGDMMQLRDRLTGDQKKVEIVPIVGMAGIGKTTLARKLYEDPCIVSHFKYHAWAIVSQDYNMKAVLLSLLHCICGKESDKKHANKKIHELQDILYHELCGRRYMIVLDDIWGIKFWDEIRMYFPDNNKGSRIVITTRESEAAKHASSQSVQHQMQLLNESESWNLLRQEVFGDEEDCPDELQGIGEKISRDCGGLPLAINVMGGLLSKVERSISVWESIAKNVASAIAEADERFFNLLTLSYSHLPNHLKPCFLYMGAFPEDHKIEGSKLVRMWIAEGFVKSNGNKSLEEEAEGCLKALVERNIIFVSKYNKYKKPIYYGMHDLLRALCIRKSKEDKFLYVGNGRVSKSRRICFAESFVLEKDDYDDTEEYCAPLIRSLITFGKKRVRFEPLRLVRVLDVLDFKYKEFPTEILQLVNLRFLAVRCISRIPSGISRLKNLQTLIVKDSSSDLTLEIFAMPELRHFEITLTIVIDEEDMKRIAPNKLQMVSKIRITESLIRRGFLESIPDIKALKFQYFGAVDLTHLHKLETLTIYPTYKFRRGLTVGLSRFKFPSGLRELVVYNHVMPPNVMTTLCALPNLEVLKMSRCKFAREGDYDDDHDNDDCDDDDNEWEVAEGDEFPSLQFLHITDSFSSKLVRLRADQTNFPKLRHLRLRRCRRLEEIPNGIGEIPTLELIELRDCSDSAVASAKQIVEEQQDNGNYTLQLRIVS